MAELINGFKGYEVIWEAGNGKELTRKISEGVVPDIVLLDISMPLMDGYETARWLTEHYPDVKILVLSMSYDDDTVLRMLKCGVAGYILKNAASAELKAALRALSKKGTYFTKQVNDALVHSFNRKSKPVTTLNEQEIEFLKLLCSDLPYKSMAPLLEVKESMVEKIRSKLFKKLQTRSRVGLVVYAIRNGIYRVG